MAKKRTKRGLNSDFSKSKGPIAKDGENYDDEISFFDTSNHPSTLQVEQQMAMVNMLGEQLSARTAEQ